MFGRATITLGIGPHSSVCTVITLVDSSGCVVMCGVCLSVDPVCLPGGACSAPSDADCCLSEVRATDSAASSAVSCSSRSSVDEHVS